LIPFGKLRFRNRPANPYLRIVPAQTSRQIWNIEFRHLVKQLAIISQALKAVRESTRNIELATILCGEFKGLPASERGRFPADIDNDVEHGTGRASDQLSLGLRVRLKMETADHSAFASQGQVALRPVSVQLMRGKFVFTIGACEKSPHIFSKLGIEDPNARQ